jgi:hypothetical protein
MNFLNFNESFMEKSKLISFISKYSLNGLIETAEWKLTEDELSTRFMSDDDNAIGEVRMSGIVNASYKHDEIFGVANTGFLVKMLSVLNDSIDITLSAKAGSVPDTLRITDGSTDVNYMLADPAIVAKAPTPKNLPEPTYEFELDKVEFIEKFIKAKAAFNDIETFILNPKKKGLELTVGNSVNKIKITIKTDVVGSATRPIAFSAKYFKEMLSTNKDMISGKIAVYERGMAQITFKHGDASVTYFLTEILNQN